MMKRTACCAVLLGLSRVALAAPLAVVTTAVPPATFEQPYTFALSALGGTPPYQWCGPAAPCPWSPDIPSTVQGTLPPGILLSPDGVLSGIPAVGGPYQFEVVVHDATGATQASNFFALVVDASGRLVIASDSVPVALLRESYDADLSAEGGTVPYGHWVILDTQRLPPASFFDFLGEDLGPVAPGGLALDRDGKLSGTPTQAGQFEISVQVTDSSTPPQVATQVVALTVVSAEGLQILNTNIAPPESAGGGGCASVRGETSAFSCVLLVAWAIVSRRRARWRDGRGHAAPQSKGDPP